MTRNIQIDMNSDVGESFGIYKLGLDEEVIPHITSANIACGFHGGGPGVMRKTISLPNNMGWKLEPILDSLISSDLDEEMWMPLLRK